MSISWGPRDLDRSPLGLRTRFEETVGASGGTGLPPFADVDGRDKLGVHRARIIIICVPPSSRTLTEFSWNDLSYFVSSLIDSGACIVSLIVPALCTRMYAIHFPFYRERPVTGSQLTRTCCVFVFDRGSGLGGGSTRGKRNEPNDDMAHCTRERLRSSKLQTYENRSPPNPRYHCWLKG